MMFGRYEFNNFSYITIRLIAQLYFVFSIDISNIYLPIIIIHNIIEGLINSGQDNILKKYKSFSKQVILNTKFLSILILLPFIYVMYLYFDINRNLYFNLSLSLIFCVFFIPSIISLKNYNITIYIYIVMLLILVLINEKDYLIIWILSGAGIINFIFNYKYLKFNKFRFGVFKDFSYFYRTNLLTLSYTSLPTLFFSINYDPVFAKNIWYLEKFKNVIVAFSPVLLRSLNKINKKIVNFSVIYKYFIYFYLSFFVLLSIISFIYLNVTYYYFIYALLPLPIFYSIINGIFKNSLNNDYKLIYSIYFGVFIRTFIPMLFVYILGEPLYILIFMLFMESIIAYEFSKK